MCPCRRCPARRRALAGPPPVRRRASQLLNHLTPRSPPMVRLLRRIPRRTVLVLVMAAATVGAPGLAQAAVPAHAAAVRPAAAVHAAAVHTAAAHAPAVHATAVRGPAAAVTAHAAHPAAAIL